MNRTLIHYAMLIMMFSPVLSGYTRDRPAPPPSRYGFIFKIDTKSLPKGVMVREVRNESSIRYFIKNTSDIPLIINERFQNDQLVSGAKLVSGRVLHYFPNGVPMQGKRHLKGWQAPFGEIPPLPGERLINKSAPSFYSFAKPGSTGTSRCRNGLFQKNAQPLLSGTTFTFTNSQSCLLRSLIISSGFGSEQRSTLCSHSIVSVCLSIINLC